jgi:integrative and conjugative element protein (TIGR02256 family)
VSRPHLLIDRTVLDHMRESARASGFRHEVGGVLLGSRRGPHLHISQATTPQAQDRSSWARFWRSPAGHQEIAQRAWKRSGGRIGYLGEWHSHPQRHPLPSSLDRSSWSSTTATHGVPLAFVIVGIESVWASIEPGKGRRWGIVQDDEAGVLFADELFGSVRPRTEAASRTG